MRRTVFNLFLSGFLTVGSVGNSKAQGLADRSSDMTSTQAEAILTELRAIHQLLERQLPTAPTARLVSPSPTVRMAMGDGWHILGRDDAPLTLLEFSDYQCPFCRRFHLETFPELKKTYVDTGKVRFVSRDLPLEFHANALLAAQAARCAGDQGKYWELRHALIANSADVSANALSRYAQDAGLDALAFQQCLKSDRHRDAIQKDMADAQTLQISGTPTFILGRTAATTMEGLRLVGAQPYSAFEAEIRQLLAGPPARPSPAPQQR